MGAGAGLADVLSFCIIVLTRVSRFRVLIDLFASRDWLRVYLFVAFLRSTLVYSLLLH